MLLAPWISCLMKKSALPFLDQWQCRVFCCRTLVCSVVGVLLLFLFRAVTCRLFCCPFWRKDYLYMQILLLRDSLLSFCLPPAWLMGVLPLLMLSLYLSMLVEVLPALVRWWTLSGGFLFLLAGRIRPALLPSENSPVPSCRVAIMTVSSSLRTWSHWFPSPVFVDAHIFSSLLSISTNFQRLLLLFLPCWSSLLLFVLTRAWMYLSECGCMCGFH